MSHLQRQLNRLFDDALIPENWSYFSNLSKIPAAELTENDEALNLKLEVPGMEAKDLDIEVTKDGILNLTLPKAESEKTKVVKVNLG